MGLLQRSATVALRLWRLLEVAFLKLRARSLVPGEQLLIWSPCIDYEWVLFFFGPPPHGRDAEVFNLAFTPGQS